MTNPLTTAPVLVAMEYKVVTTEAAHTTHDLIT